jgi:hypothetical protein
MGLMVLLGVACAGPTQAPRVVCQDCRIVCGECEQGDRFVRLQIPSPSLNQNRESFSHPTRFLPEDWRVILSAIRVQPQGNPLLRIFGAGKGQITEAFTADDVAFLSNTLSQAFAQAQPNEWVVFGVSRHRSPEITEITTGGWYIQGTDLHLLLTNYRFAVTAPAIQELVWENPLTTQGLTYDFVPGDYQKDVSVQEGLLRPTPKALSIAYQPLLSGESTAQPSPPKGSAPSVPAGPSGLSSIEERLKALKRLRDQGLITEEEYRTKRSRLLEQL